MLKTMELKFKIKIPIKVDNDKYIGKRFGKHKFSKVSPKKSIEGCIAGTIGATVLALIYTFVLNNNFSFEYSYFVVGISGIVLDKINDLINSKDLLILLYSPFSKNLLPYSILFHYLKYHYIYLLEYHFFPLQYYLKSCFFLFPAHKRYPLF